MMSLSLLKNNSSHYDYLLNVKIFCFLQLQMLNQAENVDLKQFVFTPKYLLPALPRYC